MAGLFGGVRVVEVGHPLTEYAGALMARLGAEVFLVETPGGSETRRRQPRMPGAGESSRGSMAFLVRDAGKKSVALDPDAAEDRNLLQALCERADVVIDADGTPFHPLIDRAEVGVAVTVTDRLGLGTSSIVGFAASGGMTSSGWPHQPPCNAPSWLALDGAGAYAATMAAVGLLARRAGAGPMHYEIPYEEAAVAAVTPWTRILHSHDTHAVGQGTQAARLGPDGFPIYETSDGYVRALAGTPKQWRAFVALLGNPEELVDGAFADPKFRTENADAVKLLTRDLIRGRSTRELFLEGQKLGLTISPVNTLRQFRADDHVRARGILTRASDPEFGDLEMVRTPVLVEPESLNVTPDPAPALDQHRDEARQLARTAPPRAPGADAGIDPDRPLAGHRVLELGVGAVVPESASLLALLGAEVIKLESHVHVDFLRRNAEMANESPTFNQLNLGVKSLAMDMTHPEAVAIARRLAAQCDIVMENMRGPIVHRWELDYDSVRQVRGDVIYLGSQGLGRGPYDGFQTYGPNLQTFAGVTHQWAHPDDPFPVGTTLNHPDHIAGKQALVALLAAVMRRRESGEGCFIDATQVEGAAFLIADRYLQQHHLAGDLEPLGNRSPDMAPHGCYRCADDDDEERWLALAVQNEAQWRSLAALVADDELANEALTSLASRLAAADSIDAKLAQWLRPRNVADAEAALRAARVPASRVVTGNDMAARDTSFFPALAHPVAGTRRYTGIPVLRDGTRRPVHRRPPLLGEHTEYVLHDLLNLDPEEIGRLTAEGAVGY